MQSCSGFNFTVTATPRETTLPGDVSLTLNMTHLSLRDPLWVAPSPPRYACHLSRFNGRAYSRKGDFPQSVCYNNIKPDGFAFPGDVSLTLNMTTLSIQPLCLLLRAGFTLLWRRKRYCKVLRQNPARGLREATLLRRRATPL